MASPLLCAAAASGIGTCGSILSVVSALFLSFFFQYKLK